MSRKKTNIYDVMMKLVERMYDEFTPKDFIALTTLIVGGILKLYGYDGVVGSSMIIVVGAYFGHNMIVSSQSRSKSKSKSRR